MKSGNGAPRVSKIVNRGNVSFGGPKGGPNQPGGLPWVQGKGPNAKKAKKK
jgi:hypothetical protein